MTIEHTPHDADYIDPACPRCARNIAVMRAYALHPDPLTVEPSCCELACYEDPGCACPGCTPRMIVKPAPDRGLWMGGVFLALAAVLLTLALLAAGGHLR